MHGKGRAMQACVLAQLARDNFSLSGIDTVHHFGHRIQVVVAQDPAISVTLCSGHGYMSAIWHTNSMYTHQ